MRQNVPSSRAKTASGVQAGTGFFTANRSVTGVIQ